MIIVIGAKQWTWSQQRGIRLYSDEIRQLARDLDAPDRRGTYGSLQEFVNTIDASIGSATRPTVYSREVLVVTLGELPLQCTASFSDNTDRRPAALAKMTRPSLQGYITAPEGTWLRNWVQSRMDQDLTFEYLTGDQRDVLVLV